MAIGEHEALAADDRDDGREDFDLAASHLAARAAQWRLLAISSLVALSGVLIMIFCVLAAGSEQTSAGAFLAGAISQSELSSSDLR